MKIFRADLHVHTVLSPCASIEMIPPLIVQEALGRGIQVIAITDHNSSANVESVQKAAKNSELIVLPGMELQTQEEVHCLCLFDTLDQLRTWQAMVDISLPPLENNVDFFGEQFIVDETGDYIRDEHRLLATSSRLSISEAHQKVTELGGLFIPAHVNRKAFGLIENLGFVPLDIQLEALEISRHIDVQDVPLRIPQISGYPLIQDGDVHYLEDFLGANFFKIETPSLHEIRLALTKKEGRSLEIFKGGKLGDNSL